jgi:hypothetical protein
MSTLNYTSYIAQTSNLMVIPATDPTFVVMAPGMIDYAEGRIYRDLDPLRQQVVDQTSFTSSGVRDLVPPTGIGTYISIDKLNLITPATIPSSIGTRVPLVPVSQEFIDISFPSNQGLTAVPTFYAMVSDTQIVLGPAPDKSYQAEFIGVQRPTPLSFANSSTYLTQYCPDLFIAASMVFAFGYMRDFGAQADNPQAAQSWENQFQMLFKSAQTEQLRAKFQAEGWTVKSPSPIATPSRV